MSRLEQYEEIALAMAQSTVADAIERSPLSQSGVAKQLGINRSFITRVLRGDHNLTVKTMARICAAAGFELRFGVVPVAKTKEPQR